jgi:hypothetical protein
VAAATAAEQEESDFGQWIEHGNPFNDEATETIVKGVIAEGSGSNSSAGILKKLRGELMALLAAEESSNEASGTGGAFTSKYVVTNVALSGFTKYAGKYMEMMTQLPLIAAESFVGLTQLFDFYLYTIFTVFVDKHASELMFKTVPPYSAVQQTMESAGFAHKYMRLEQVYAHSHSQCAPAPLTPHPSPCEPPPTPPPPVVRCATSSRT